RYTDVEDPGVVVALKMAWVGHDVTRSVTRSSATVAAETLRIKRDAVSRLTASALSYSPLGDATSQSSANSRAYDRSGVRNIRAPLKFTPDARCVVDPSSTPIGGQRDRRAYWCSRPEPVLRPRFGQRHLSPP